MTIIIIIRQCNVRFYAHNLHDYINYGTIILCEVSSIVWNYCEIIAKLLWNYCEIIVKLLWNYCEIIVKLLWNYCEIIVKLLWNYCVKRERRAERSAALDRAVWKSCTTGNRLTRARMKKQTLNRWWWW